MDFHLTKEQLLVRKMYREFAENEVKPLAAEIDEEERFPMETVEKMAKLGMMGIYFPKEYGGAGLGQTESADLAAGAQVRQILHLLLLGAVLKNGGGAQGGMSRDDNGSGAADLSLIHI